MKAEIIEGKLYLPTPLGILIAYANESEEYPGIYIDLKRDGYDTEAPLALVEYTETEAGTEGEGKIISRIWGRVTDADYTERVYHKGIPDFFRSHPEREQ